MADATGGNEGSTARTAPRGRVQGKRSNRTPPCPAGSPRRRSPQLAQTTPNQVETTHSPASPQTALQGLEGNRTSMEASIKSHSSPVSSPSLDTTSSPEVPSNSETRVNAEVSSSPDCTPPVLRAPQLANTTTSTNVCRSSPRESSSMRQGVSRPDRTSPTRRSPRLSQQSPGHKDNSMPSEADMPTTNSRLYQLIIRPIVKSAIGQRDISGETLDDIVGNGSSFTDLLNKVWELFCSRIKRRAVKRDEEWSVVVPDMQDWSKVMQFKSKRHIVDSTKLEQAWNSWPHSVRGQTIKLLIYEYGAAITTVPTLADFKRACIVPLVTD
ncbi:hypothetical protein PC129_g7267 [Phytophthora cactorum]|uniref:Uncharacterized protein n=1 Tax=Phytophthora cactorum TaxID=29920 RepID=A0A329RT12_9STRA|nr:hypothetical protein Pcac1_g17720 [Phytophthora cactorum]KAG2858887.1 hypothetical protein PC113_g9435 [Phytophthora cactorum]KAG2908010.1 hypothetical protein PC114_g10630 [Phytophthora cactorum]KAG2922644.1 hypothetical protein PC115_g9184 [Phytophthora cactorum]KAG2945187.1 hypothetical protein PC117_g8662 [Phytophthora cactorum]